MDKIIKRTALLFVISSINFIFIIIYKLYALSIGVTWIIQVPAVTIFYPPLLSISVIATSTYYVVYAIKNQKFKILFINCLSILLSAIHIVFCWSLTVFFIRAFWHSNMKTVCLNNKRFFCEDRAKWRLFSIMVSMVKYYKLKNYYLLC